MSEEQPTVDEMSSQVSSEEKRDFDFVVFGASGFTGQYVVEEVARTLDEEKGLSWAVAGRSMQKIQKVLSNASKYTGRNLEEVPILIVDISSEASVQEMCQKTKVVVNCVGPYRFYGEAVVRACVENKTHHIDISGEPEYLEKMQLLYHNKAKEAGAYILGACGWDSVPAEMGFLFTRNQGEVESIEAYTEIKWGPEGGCINSGTWQSAIHGLANAKNLSAIRKELFPERLPIKKTSYRKRGSVFYNKDVDSYCVPFLGSDKSIVTRTQRYNYDVKKQEPIQFNIFMKVPGVIALAGLMVIGLIMSLFCRFSFGRWLLESYPSIMSLGVFSKQGPTRKQIEGASFTMTMFGTVPEEQKKIVTKVTGPEPGYAATPIILMQATYALLKEQDQLPDNGGVYTPGVAFAETNLLDRLSKNNIKFEVVEAP